MHSNLYDHFHYVLFVIINGLGERHDKTTQHLSVILRPRIRANSLKHEVGTCAHGLASLDIGGGQNLLFHYSLI